MLIELHHALQFARHNTVYDSHGALVGLNSDGEFYLRSQQGRQISKSECKLHLFTGINDVSRTNQPT